jgi:hypothetical protein
MKIRKIRKISKLKIRKIKMRMNLFSVLPWSQLHRLGAELH